MKRNVYSIRDIHVGFMSPIIDENDTTAMRNFAFAVNNSDNIMNFRPQDFQLFFLGTFDTESAIFESADIPQLVCEGSSVYKE